MQLLSSPGYSHILEDLHILASSLPDEDGGYFPALEEHYMEVGPAALLLCLISHGASSVTFKR